MPHQFTMSRFLGVSGLGLCPPFLVLHIQVATEPLQMGSMGFFKCAVIGLASWAQHLFKRNWTLQEGWWSKDGSEVLAVNLTCGKRVGPSSRPSRSKPFVEWEKGLSLHRFSKWVSAIIYVTHVLHVSVTLINLICSIVHTSAILTWHHSRFCTVLRLFIAKLHEV